MENGTVVAVNELRNALECPLECKRRGHRLMYADLFRVPPIMMNIPSLQNIVFNKGQIDYLNDPAVPSLNHIFDKFRLKHRCVICDLYIEANRSVPCAFREECPCYPRRTCCFRCAINAPDRYFDNNGFWTCGCEGDDGTFLCY